MTQDIHLSIVVPVYNEETRIGPTLELILSFLRTKSYPAEVLVVDDGSRDKSAEIAEHALRDFTHAVFRNPENHGKGYVVRQGMLAARGDYLLFTDADLSTPIEEVDRLLDQLQRGGYDLVIGSRALRESKVEVRQPFYREAMGRLYNLLAQLFAFRSVHDSQCGFKLFKREVAHALFTRQKIDRFSFDAEIIYLAQKLKFKLLEAPVIWRNSVQSRVSPLKDSCQMFLDLIKIRWIHRDL